MPIVAQLIALFLPILTDLLKRWLDDLLSSVHREGMSREAVVDAALAQYPWYSLRPVSRRRRALLLRMQAALAERPVLLTPLTLAERADLGQLTRPVHQDLAAERPSAA